MKKRFRSDLRLRKVYQQKEFINIFLKKLHHKKKLTNVTKVVNLQANSQLKKTRIKNFCLISGRSRSTYRNYKISRLEMKKLIENGVLPGFSKGSW